MKTIPIAVTALALSAALAACGSSGSKSDDAKGSSSSMPSMSGTTTKAGGTTVTIKSFGYAVPASVTPGATLTVTNNDSVAHTFTLKSAHIDKKVAAGGRITVAAPKAAGTYGITCDYHPNMHSDLVVK